MAKVVGGSLKRKIFRRSFSYKTKFSEMTYAEKRLALFLKPMDGKLCEDVVFAAKKKGTLVLGVLDGVGGEAFGYVAAHTAMEGVLEAFCQYSLTASKDSISFLVQRAYEAMEKGKTTLSLAIVEKSGRFACGAVGDSPVYLIKKDGASFLCGGGRDLESTPLLHTFLKKRFRLSACLSELWNGKFEFYEGRLQKGDMLALMTDGVADNFAFKLNSKKSPEFDFLKVTDIAGVEELGRILSGISKAGEAVNVLVELVRKRLKELDEKCEYPYDDDFWYEDGYLIAPKEDDMAIAIYIHR